MLKSKEDKEREKLNLDIKCWTYVVAGLIVCAWLFGVAGSILAAVLPKPVAHF